MRRNGFEASVHVPVGRSRRLYRAVLALHALAATLLAASLPASVGLGILLAGVAASALASAGRLRRPRADDIAAVLLGTGDDWQVTLRDGHVLAARPLRPPFVHAALLVLALRCEDGRVRHAALLADNTPAAALRRLRVRLRHPRGVS